MPNVRTWKRAHEVRLTTEQRSCRPVYHTKYMLQVGTRSYDRPPPERHMTTALVCIYRLRASPPTLHMPKHALHNGGHRSGPQKGGPAPRERATWETTPVCSICYENMLLRRGRAMKLTPHPTAMTCMTVETHTKTCSPLGFGAMKQTPPRECFLI